MGFIGYDTWVANKVWDYLIFCPKPRSASSLVGRGIFFMEKTFWTDGEGIKHYIWEPEKDKEKPQKTFWVRTPKKWWLETLKGLNPIQRCLLISLRCYADRKGFCYPSLRRLSVDLGISINSTRKYLRILEEKKHIKIIITKKGYWNKWSYFLYQI